MLNALLCARYKFSSSYYYLKNGRTMAGARPDMVSGATLM